MGKKDDDGQDPPICGTCLGAKGEYIDRNGDSKKQSIWVDCSSCGGVGRK